MALYKLSKGYASVVLSDSEVAFLGGGKDIVFGPFLYCVLFIHSGIVLKRSKSS